MEEKEEIIPGASDKHGKFDRKGKKGRKSFRGRGRTACSGNDFSYWNKYSELIESATKIPWNYIPGTNVKIPGASPRTMHFYNVMTLEYLSTPGVNTASTDPFNLQMRKTWLDMHRKYRGLGAYQQADLAIILFCVKEVFSGLGECGRIYGIYSSYPVENRILPRGILRAMGYNTSLLDSIETNLADFLYGVNRLIRKARQLCLPKNLSVLRNQLGLTSFLYTDAKGKKAAIYSFKPMGYWEYRAGNISTGSAAFHRDLKRSDATLYPTYVEFLKFFEDLIDILLMDDDVTRVCSDLIAAYGEGGTEALVPFDSGYSVTPLYDESILHKIHNSENLGIGSLARHLVSKFPATGTVPSICSEALSAEACGLSTTDYLWIVQTDNTVFFKPALVTIALNASSIREYTDGSDLTNYPAGNKYYSFAGLQSGGTHPLDTWKESPDAADVCEGCLWKPVLNPTYAGNDEDGMPNGIFDVLSCSTEIITMVYCNAVVNAGVPNVQVELPSTVLRNSTALAAMYRGLAHFDWHPLVPIATQNLTANVPEWTMIEDFVGDIDNFTLTEDSVISRIHDAALLSAFAIDATVSK